MCPERCTHVRVFRNRVAGLSVIAVIAVCVLLFAPTIALGRTVVADSYAETNWAGASGYIYSGIERGQAFAAVDGTLDSAKVLLQRVGTPTGSAYAYLYRRSGWYGIDSYPWGPPLATSAPVDVSTISSSPSGELITFHFDNSVSLQAGNKYALVVAFAGGDSANKLGLAHDSSSPSHLGNAVWKDPVGTAGMWQATGDDTIFYVYQTRPDISNRAVITGRLTTDPTWGYMPSFLNVSAVASVSGGGFATYPADYVPGFGNYVFYTGQWYELIVPPGSYTVVAGSGGINTQTRTITVSEGEVASMDFDLTYDVVPPDTVETNISPSRWYRSPSEVVAHFEITDDLTGVCEVSWRINNGGESWHDFNWNPPDAKRSEALTVTLSPAEPWIEGSNTLEWYARDCGDYWTDLPAYNVESRKSKSVLLDWTPPRTALSIDSSRTIHASSTDTLSGVYETYWRVKGETSWRRYSLDSTLPREAGGECEVEFFSVDVAGNQEATQFAIPPVVFGDPRLESAIRATLGIAQPLPISRTDMLGLTSLSARGLGITDLTGLETALNLSLLRLDDNEISNLWPLAGLTQLTDGLSLNNNQVSDISALSGLTNLVSLGLGGNDISDTSPIAGLTHLQSVNLGGNRIVDLEPLGGLADLTQLDLRRNNISDVSILAGLTNLAALNLEYNRVSDTSPLAGLAHLTQLFLERNRVAEIGPLSDLPSLTWVTLAENYLDLTPGSPAMATIVALETRGVTVFWSPQYLPPEATPMSVATVQDVPVDVIMMGRDPDGHGLDYTIVSSPRHGSLGSIVGNRVTYTPAPGYVGEDSFTFRATDGVLSSAAAMASVAVGSATMVRGTATDARTGAPLPGVSVVLYHYHPYYEVVAETVTDSRGDYTFSRESSHGTGRYFVRSSPTGYAAQDGMVEWNGIDSVLAELALMPISQLATGTVIDTATGMPIQGAYVAAYRYDAGLNQDVPVATTATDGAGRFTLEYTGSLPPGEYWFYAVSGAGHSTGRATRDWDGLSTVSLEFALQPAIGTGLEIDGYEPDDSPQEANEIGVSGISQHRSLSPYYDVDWVKFDAVAGKTYTVEKTPGSTASGTFVCLFASDGQTPLTSEYCDVVVRFKWTADRAGTVYLRLTDQDGWVLNDYELTVTGVNDAPVAAAQSKTTPEDTAVQITLAGTDPDGDELTYAIATPPAHGTLSTVADGKVTYTPDANYAGADSFTFTASDASASSLPATVSLTVTGVNDAPVAAAQSKTTAEETPVQITLAGTDADGDELTYAIATPPAHGTLSTVADGKVTYTPDANYAGADSFTFTASDASTSSAPATVSLTVTGVNDAPVATAGSKTTAEETPVQITLAGTDPDGDELTYAIATPPAHGSLSTVADGKVTYTPDANYAGADSFTFTASDASASSLPATVSLTVTGVNDAPVATAGSKTTAEETPVQITLAGTDADGDELTYAIATLPAHGSLSTVADGKVTYTPDANYAGADSFTFTASDASTSSAPATVSLTVTGVNDAPVATAGSKTTAEETPVQITLAGTDADGDELTYAIATPPAHGSLSTVADGKVTYTPDANYAGADSFTFTASDASTSSAPATVSLTVTGVNDAPVATAGSKTTAEETPVQITLAGTDADGDELTYAIATPPAHGSLSTVADGKVTYTPDANYAGADSFTFTASDASTSSAPATVSLTIAPRISTEVSIDPVGIVLGFDSVLDVGTSSAAESSGHQAPSGFRVLRGDYYDISTTAVFTGFVTVTIPYNESDLEGVNESNLKLFHWKNNGWDEITVSVDTVKNTITGRTDSFSPFAVMAPAGAFLGQSPTGTVGTSRPKLSIRLYHPSGIQSSGYSMKLDGKTVKPRLAYDILGVDEAESLPMYDYTRADPVIPKRGAHAGLPYCASDFPGLRLVHPLDDVELQCCALGLGDAARGPVFVQPQVRRV